MRWRLNQPEIERMVRHAIDDRLRVRHRHVRLHLGVRGLELAEDLREDVFGDRHARAERKRAGHAAGQVGHARVHLLGQREHALGVVHDEASGGRERNAPVAALEESCVEMLLELLHLERDGGLRHEQLLRGLGEGKLLCDGMEDLEAPIGHRTDAELIS